MSGPGAAGPGLPGAPHVAQAQGSILPLLILMGLLALLAWLLIPVFTRWSMARKVGVKLGFIVCLSQRMRRVDTVGIIEVLVLGKDLQLDVDDLENHMLAGGRILHVVQALVAAHAAGVSLDFHQVAAIDLLRQDPLAAVTTWLKSGSRDPKALVAQAALAHQLPPSA